MPTYSLDLSATPAISFAPSSEVEEVMQNVRTIISSRVGTVPLHRDFGLSADVLDKPVNLAQILFQTAVIQALAQFEPRAKLAQIDFSTRNDLAQQGVLTPILSIEIEEQNDGNNS